MGSLKNNNYTVCVNLMKFTTLNLLKKIERNEKLFMTLFNLNFLYVIEK